MRRCILSVALQTQKELMFNTRILKLVLISLLSLQLMACVNSNYTYGTQGMDARDGDSPAMQQQFIVGRPNALLDASDWIWPSSLLSKLILWNKNVDSHQISTQTIDELDEYIQKNELDDVQVLVNAYSPGNQWKRLFRNKEVGAGWRYTLGMLSVASYTILPRRFFGGDHYNVYTNSIHIYSDDSAIALHEAGHAKDFNSRKYKGTNAAIYAIPGAALYYEAKASSDALSYMQYHCRPTELKDGYKILYPAYGTYVGGTAARDTGLGFLGVIPGHIAGAIAAAKVDRSDEAYATNQECQVEERAENQRK